MFSAVVIFCAFVGGEINHEHCMTVEDTFGPFKTEENCEIRTNQMKKQLLSNPRIYFSMTQVLKSKDIRALGVCSPVKENGSSV